jgi:cytochrome c551/c552
LNRIKIKYLKGVLIPLFFITSLSFNFLFSQEEQILTGKKLFNTHCAACHKVKKKAIGPAMRGVSEKYDREWLYSWIKNSASMIKSGDPQAVAIWEEYNRTAMNAFPQLSNVDIDNILAYADYIPPVPVVAQSLPVSSGGENTGNYNDLILIALVLVFLILTAMLILVKRTLIRIASASGVKIVSEKKPKDNIALSILSAFAKNQFLVISSVILLMLSSGYYVYAWMMQVGIDEGYMPVQPIHYSHKIHSGANKIECKYCHSSARVSKHSGIPSLNVCMNCHKNIAEYNGEEDLENGYDRDFYTNEIKKLYAAVGWDEDNQVYTGKTQPVKWVRIHNLPDHVYFNHAQHVEVANIECQKCHGPVEEMEIMYQYSPLTMGWCINCHRESNIDLKGNEYYKKIHEELSKKYGVEKLTVAQMGGLECGKCHY